ncbi:hypothetical protein DZF79_28530 [Vibrio parahaemolyticus]|nr:hypothetical protein [Vibrio parahaemolyticus]
MKDHKDVRSAIFRCKEKLRKVLRIFKNSEIKEDLNFLSDKIDTTEKILMSESCSKEERERAEDDLEIYERSCNHLLLSTK